MYQSFPNCLPLWYTLLCDSCSAHRVQQSTTLSYCRHSAPALGSFIAESQGWGAGWPPSGQTMSFFYCREPGLMGRMATLRAKYDPVSPRRSPSPRYQLIFLLTSSEASWDSTVNTMEGKWLTQAVFFKFWVKHQTFFCYPYFRICVMLGNETPYTVMFNSSV